MDLSRRGFIKKTAALTSAPIVLLPLASWSSSIDINKPLDISIFSKHLQFLDYEQTGKMASAMGFSGVDLTVRPKGHVLPKFVKSDLPEAIKGIEAGGSKYSMITTRIEDAHNSLDRDIIETASECGIKYFRSNWFKYSDQVPMQSTLDRYQEQVGALSVLNGQNGIIGCYQNHAGVNVGSSFWEIHRILDQADQKYFGIQYDIRHAMVEGGNSWVNGIRLLRDNIKTIVLKDYKWDKINGKWRLLNVPIGEGMIDFSAYFKN